MEAVISGTGELGYAKGSPEIATLPFDTRIEFGHLHRHRLVSFLWVLLLL